MLLLALAGVFDRVVVSRVCFTQLLRRLSKKLRGVRLADGIAQYFLSAYADDFFVAIREDSDVQCVNCRKMAKRKTETT